MLLCLQEEEYIWRRDLRTDAVIPQTGGDLSLPEDCNWLVGNSQLKSMEWMVEVSARKSAKTAL